MLLLILQIIDYLSPLIPDPNTVKNLEETMLNVNDFLSEVGEIKKDIKNIHASINAMKLIRGYEALKKDEKQENGNRQ